MIGYLASQFLEKHIPSAERLELPELDPAQRVDLVLPTSKDEHEEVSELRKLLRYSDGMLAHALPGNLRELSALRPAIRASRQKGAIHDAQSQGRVAEDHIERSEKKNPSAAARFAVEQIWKASHRAAVELRAGHRELLSQTVLRPESRRPLSGVVSVELVPSFVLSPFIGRGSFEVVANVALEAYLGSPPNRDSVSNGALANLFGDPQLDWDEPSDPSLPKSMLDDPPRRTGSAVRLPSRLAHSYGLLLATIPRKLRGNIESLLSGVRATPAAFREFESGDLTRSAPATLRVEWRLPLWDSLGTYVWFFAKWNEICRYAEATSPGDLTRRFVHLCLVGTLEEAGEEVVPDSSDEIHDESLSYDGTTLGWEYLVERCLRVPRAGGWFMSTLLFLTRPESGLLWHEANEVYQALERKVRFPDDANEIRRTELCERARLTATGASELAEAFCRTVDATRQYTWTANHERAPAAIDATLSRATTILSSLTTRNNKGRLGPFDRLSIDHYRLREIEEWSDRSRSRFVDVLESADSAKFSNARASKVLAEVWEDLASSYRVAETSPSVRIVFPGAMFSWDLNLEEAAFKYDTQLPAELPVEMKFVHRWLSDARTADGDADVCPVGEGHALNAPMLWRGIVSGTFQHYAWPLPAYREYRAWEWWVLSWNGLVSRGLPETATLDHIALSFLQAVGRFKASSPTRPEWTVEDGEPAELGQRTKVVFEQLSKDRKCEEYERRWFNLARCFFARPELSGVTAEFADALGAHKEHPRFQKDLAGLAVDL